MRKINYEIQHLSKHNLFIWVLVSMKHNYFVVLLNEHFHTAI